MKFVSRAGEKLQFAIDNFNISVNNLVCADFGSSTGGFVDVLLKNGAKKVYSVDTAYGELDWNLRNDPRVVVMERTNAMHVKLPEKVDLITIDVGWTKQSKIIPNALSNLSKNGQIISLIKPHYEADKKFITRGKLEVKFEKKVLDKVKKDIEMAGAKIISSVQSPIVGKKRGNSEYLYLLTAWHDGV